MNGEIELLKVQASTNVIKDQCSLQDIQDMSPIPSLLQVMTGRKGDSYPEVSTDNRHSMRIQAIRHGAGMALIKLLALTALLDKAPDRKTAMEGRSFQKKEFYDGLRASKK